jgi:hypothetical protein
MTEKDDNPLVDQTSNKCSPGSPQGDVLQKIFEALKE